MSELEKVKKDLLEANQLLEAKVKKLEELNNELSMTNSELKMLDKIKDEFVNIASHELRGPLHPILGYVAMAKSGKVDPMIALDVIYVQALKLKQVAYNILDASKIESQTLAYDLRPIRIHEILLNSMVAAAGTVDRSKVSLIANIDKKYEDLEIVADKARIEQVFTNVLGNAVKFTKHGSITVETHVNKDSNSIEIQVIDTGPGIPDKILPRLFEKFETLSTYNENVNGLGLGLFISKAIVVAHSGEIKATNNNEKGATIKIKLPLDLQVRDGKKGFLH